MSKLNPARSTSSVNSIAYFPVASTFEDAISWHSNDSAESWTASVDSHFADQDNATTTTTTKSVSNLNVVTPALLQTPSDSFIVVPQAGKKAVLSVQQAQQQQSATNLVVPAASTASSSNKSNPTLSTPEVVKTSQSKTTQQQQPNVPTISLPTSDQQQQDSKPAPTAAAAKQKKLAKDSAAAAAATAAIELPKPTYTPLPERRVKRRKGGAGLLFFTGHTWICPYTGLTREEKKAVQDNWRFIQRDLKTAGVEMFLRYFVKNADHQELFRNAQASKQPQQSARSGGSKSLAMTALDINNSSMRQHAYDVMEILNVVIDGLWKPAELEELLMKLGRNHAHHEGVQNKHFITFQEMLMNYLEYKVRHYFHADAWSKLLTAIMSVVERGFKKECSEAGSLMDKNKSRAALAENEGGKDVPQSCKLLKF